MFALFFFFSSFFLQGPVEGSFSRHADGTCAWQMQLPTAVPAMGHSVWSAFDCSGFKSCVHVVCVLQPGGYVSELRHDAWRDWRLPFGAGWHCPGGQNHQHCQQGGTVHYKWGSTFFCEQKKNNYKNKRKESKRRRRKSQWPTWPFHNLEIYRWCCV